jgi:sigma-B regulation protein RsbU (phosphoserine phosphatase)
VGGDFYDFMETDPNGGFAMVIADVSGKGMPAALLAAQIQAALRSEVFNHRKVSDTVTNVNNIVANLSSSSGKYATMFYGVFRPEKNEFEYSNAGHNFPILVRADGSHELLVDGGTIIGVFEGTPYEAKKVRLKPEYIIFFYTDGLSEAQNHEQEEYGENRILEYITAHRREPAGAIKDGILEQVSRFSPNLTPEDDTTIVILKMNDLV